MHDEMEQRLREAIAGADDPARIERLAAALSALIRAKKAMQDALDLADSALASATSAGPNTLRGAQLLEQLCAHEAMRLVLDEAGTALFSREIAREINARGLYRMQDGRPIHTSQVSARASNYPQIFLRLPDRRIGLRSRDDELVRQGNQE